MPTGHKIKIGKGFAIKEGKPARSEKKLSVSERIRRRKSKRVKAVNRGTVL